MKYVVTTQRRRLWRRIETTEKDFVHWEEALSCFKIRCWKEADRRKVPEWCIDQQIRTCLVDLETHGLLMNGRPESIDHTFFFGCHIKSSSVFMTVHPI